MTLKKALRKLFKYREEWDFSNREIHKTVSIDLGYILLVILGTLLIRKKLQKR